MNFTRTIAVMTREKFTSSICHLYENDDPRDLPATRKNERVEFRADSDVDADGANCQFGHEPAYRPGNHGLDDLRNISPSDLICHHNSGTPIVFHDTAGREFYASRTSLLMPGATDPQDPKSFVDSCHFPFTVVPPAVKRRTTGKILGCQAILTNRRSGLSARFVVADFGPATKDGENSIEGCNQLGIDPNPRSGGLDDAVIDYIILPGVPAIVTCRDGSEFTFTLQ